MEEFDEKFPINTRKYTTELAQGWVDLTNDLKKDFKVYSLSSQLSIIQAIDEWAEKNCKERGAERIYLSDLRSFLKEAKNKLQ